MPHLLQVVSCGARVLARLMAYGAAARFQAAAEAAVRAVAGSEAQPSTGELQGLVGQAAAALASLAAALGACRPGGGGSSDRTPAVVGAFAPDGELLAAACNAGWARVCVLLCLATKGAFPKQAQCWAYSVLSRCSMIIGP